LESPSCPEGHYDDQRRPEHVAPQHWIGITLMPGRALRPKLYHRRARTGAGLESPSCPEGHYDARLRDRWRPCLVLDWNHPHARKGITTEQLANFRFHFPVNWNHPHARKGITTMACRSVCSAWLFIGITLMPGRALRRSQPPRPPGRI